MKNLKKIAGSFTIFTILVNWSSFQKSKQFRLSVSLLFFIGTMTLFQCSSSKKMSNNETSTTKTETSKMQFHYTSMLHLLQLQGQGLDIVNDIIMIRGVTSLTKHKELPPQQPLFVLDGIVLGRGIYTVDHLDPNTVKSVQVIKGPEAASYGTRGASGVIEITIK